jgi:diaminopimelate decarboxylase
MFRYYRFKDSDLILGGIPARMIAEKYNTPLYVYDIDILNKKMELLRSSIPAEVDIFFSVKANPNLFFSHFFKKKGWGCEVASKGEFLVALKAGVPPGDIIFAGPGKTKEELEYAVANRIYCINVESHGELQHIVEISKKLKTPVNVGVRINPSYSIKGPRITMGGKARQFGIDEDQLDAFFERLKQAESLTFKGIHVYQGTQNLNARSIIESWANIGKLAIQVSRKYNVKIEMINFGGGMGVPYYKGDEELDISSVGKAFKDILLNISQNLGPGDIRFIIEPGRYLTAESGVYLTTVLYVKKSREKKFVITDGGLHHFQPLGQILMKHFPMNIVHKIGQPETGKVIVTGKLCTSIDTLAENLSLPEVEPGDVIGIYKTGAYGYSASLSLFLSHPSPLEVIAQQGRTSVIREKSSDNDFIRLQKVDGVHTL